MRQVEAMGFVSQTLGITEPLKIYNERVQASTDYSIRSA